jgi:hypothetical protein
MRLVYSSMRMSGPHSVIFVCFEHEASLDMSAPQYRMFDR